MMMNRTGLVSSAPALVDTSARQVVEDFASPVAAAFHPGEVRCQADTFLVRVLFAGISEGSDARRSNK